MIFDLQSTFSDKQAITGDAPSTNVIDLGPADTPKHAKGPVTRGLGRGADVPVRIQTTEGFDNLTSLTIEVQVDDDEAFGSPTTVASVTVLAAELAAAGYVAPLQYMPRGVEQRYVRLNYDVTGTAPTTGAITAGLVFGNDTWTA